MRGEIPSTSAASAEVSPAKYRSLTSFAAELVGLGQFAKGLVEGEQIVGTFGGKVSGGQVGRGYIVAAHFPAALEAGLAAGRIHQNPPHGLRGGSEEMSTAVEVLGILHVHEPQVGLMNSTVEPSVCPGRSCANFAAASLRSSS